MPAQFFPPDAPQPQGVSTTAVDVGSVAPPPQVVQGIKREASADRSGDGDGVDEGAANPFRKLRKEDSEISNASFHPTPAKCGQWLKCRSPDCKRVQVDKGGQYEECHKCGGINFDAVLPPADAAGMGSD